MNDAACFSVGVEPDHGVMSRWSALHLQIHHFGMWHHILIQVGHDHERTCEDQEHDEHAKRERQDIVAAVRSGRDVKKS